MSRSPRWSLLAVFAVVAIVFAACTPAATSPSPSTPTATASQPPASVAPFDEITYPEDGHSVCGTEGYSGIMGLIRATDARTVEFNLCSSDAAFLSKIAFTSLAIND